MTKDDLNKFVSHVLMNNNGRIESQRINTAWLTRNGHNDVASFFIEHEIDTAESLYKFLTGNTGICNCGSVKRFVGFRDGYKDLCVKCAKTQNNNMKQQGTVNVDINDVPLFVKCSGKYSSSKIKKLSELTINKIIERTSYLNNPSISERIYHIEHNLFCLPTCKTCNKEHNKFKTSISGYSNWCSSKCANSDSELRLETLKVHHYHKYADTFKSNESYRIELFTLDDYLNSRECKIKFTHLKCNYTYTLDKDYQGSIHCPKCFPIRSKIQYAIYKWLSQYAPVKFNDRKLIKPKEIDILTDKFGIEYDSQMFHSYGLSDLSILNNVVEDKNCHLYKTELVEKQGLQLFRIFSTEWCNKQDIWKSVILSKLGLSKRIYARSCEVKEIDSKTANDFITLNHLQGPAKQSVRLGLFYNDKLVSVMTFGKSRYNKNYEYELIRFCNEINLSVVGGAGKLLKYFERTYNPKSIISYANRRWSQGNLYEKLGFTFVKNTTPGYFYFKGDLGKLESREKFQKHKLKNILKSYDENKTETENMFLNGYRKIYDSGNKVYIKMYK